MRCEEFQTQLSAFLDGEMTQETAACIEAHLTGCVRCSEAHDEIGAVLAMTRAWNVEGGEVLAGIQQQIQQDTMYALLREVQRLRVEVDSLRAEVADIKSREARRAATAGRESSVLRFPYATVRDGNRSLL